MLLLNLAGQNEQLFVVFLPICCLLEVARNAAVEVASEVLSEEEVSEKYSEVPTSLSQLVEL